MAATKNLTGFTYDEATRTAEIDFYENGKGSKRVRRTLKDISRRDAEAVYRRLREDVRRGDVKLGRKPTLNAYVERYPRQKRLTKKSLSTRKYILADLLAFFGELRIDKITTDIVRGYIDARTADGIESATIRRRLSELRAMLGEAIERGIIVKLPFSAKVIFAAVPDSDPLVRYLTSAERTTLLAAFDNEAAYRAHVEANRKQGSTAAWKHGERRFGGSRRGDSDATGTAYARFRALKPYVTCLLDAGLRRDDARLLAWERVNLTDRTIFLYQSKTGDPVFIPLTATLAAALLALDAVRDPANPYVFVTDAGKPYSISTINRAWKIAKAIAGITRPFRLHDCRHTTGSGLVQAGVQLAEVGELLGHRDLRSTRRYAHLAPENLRAAIQKLERWQRGTGVGNPVVTRRPSLRFRLGGALRDRACDHAEVPETKRAARAARGQVRLERATGLEPATSTLARLHSTN
jgi:integrase